MFSLFSTLDWGLSDLLLKGLLLTFLYSGPTGVRSRYISSDSSSKLQRYVRPNTWYNSVRWLKSSSPAMQGHPCSSDKQALWGKKPEWTLLLRCLCGDRSWGGASLWAKSSRNMHDGIPWYRSLLPHNGLCHLQNENRWKRHAVSWSKAEWDAPVPHSDSEVESKRQRWLYRCPDIDSGSTVPDWWLGYVISVGKHLPHKAALIP